LKVCLDVGHTEVSVGFPAFWKVAKERCIALHVHDNDSHADLHLVPGNGSINWHEIFLTLREDNFKGAVNVELFLDEHKVEAKRYLEKVWGNIELLKVSTIDSGC
jgi:sugar phosphate isomerase/epimerase